MCIYGSHQMRPYILLCTSVIEGAWKHGEFCNLLKTLPSLDKALPPGQSLNQSQAVGTSLPLVSKEMPSPQFVHCLPTQPSRPACDPLLVDVVQELVLLHLSEGHWRTPAGFACPLAPNTPWGPSQKEERAIALMEAILCISRKFLNSHRKYL